MPRFFIEEDPQGEYLLDGENGRHAVRSLRMRPGEKLTLCNGKGKDFLCTVISCGEEGARVQVEEERENTAEPKTRITVCQCWPKGDKAETVVQKSVELGAMEIWPLESARCVVKPDAKAAEKKRARLQKIALEAAKQSGRGIVPQVLPGAELKEALTKAAEQGDVLFFYEEGKESLRTALEKTADRLFIFIGPEGGFAPEEAEFARSVGAVPLTLGPRILRTETAPLAALAAILYQKGEMEL